MDILEKMENQCMKLKKIDHEDDDSRSRRIGKRPDFQWQLYNDSAPINSNLYSTVFTIECKRLGDKVKNRNLFSAYTKQGILRFIDRKWSYGDGVKSGAMIGYIQSSNEKLILFQVNKINLKNSLNEIKPDQKQKGISILKQEIKREYIKPKDFKLNHIWVKLI